MKADVLASLMQADGYVSGEALSEKLGISRSAVWKAVKALRSQGYEIESATNRGYRLLHAPDFLNAENLRIYLKTRELAKHIYWKKVTGSTNDDAKAADPLCPDKSLFAAEQQTGGKGRLGRQWVSPMSENIYMSLLLKPDIEPDRLSPITLLAGLAVREAVCDVCMVDAQIKWPNDVLAGGKKICGILAEMVCELDKINCVVLGIGINVNQEVFPPEIEKKATSLKLEGGRKVDRAVLACAVLERFEHYYDAFLKEGITKEVLKRYEDNCINIGAKVTAQTGGQAVSGVATGVLPTGELVINTGGKTVFVKSGEVTLQSFYQEES